MDIDQEDVLGTILRETEPLKDKMVYNLSKHLFDVSKIRMIADLNLDQINYFIKLIIINDLFFKKYHVILTKQKNGTWKTMEVVKGRDTFTKLFTKMLELTISKGRQSRQEIVMMFQMARIQAETERRRGMLGRG